MSQFPFSPVHAAVVQAAPVAFDLDQSLQKLADLASSAAAGGAKLALFPEAFLSAYPRGSTFGGVIGNRTPEGRDWYRRYWESSVDIPGPVIDRLTEYSQSLDLFLVVGVIERDGGTLYCTVVFVSPQDGYLGKHRKLMPTAAERLVWGFGDGSTLPVFDTDMGRIGAAICWENYMPMLRMSLYGKGIEIYCAPTADMRDTWISSMQHVAMEGRCFVLSCNQFATRSDYPDSFPMEFEDAPETVVSRGGSCIVDPLGQLIAGPIYGEETILTAELDLNDVIRGKYDFDVVGHYARPDVFRLRVNGQAQPAVHYSADPPPFDASERDSSEHRDSIEKST